MTANQRQGPEIGEQKSGVRAGVKRRQIGWVSAGAIVVANMIGTGAFTTLGLQIQDTRNSWSILSVWVIGALISILGAFSYAELGTHLRRSGGEYHFLSKTFHPLLGYLSGWIAMTVGFSAPIALSAMAIGAYLEKFIPFSTPLLAIAIVVVIGLAHSFHLRQSSRFQNVFTLLKLLLIAGMIAAGIFSPTTEQTNAFDWSSGWTSEIWLPAYAVALIYVNYAYSGWNAAAYIVEEIRQPRRNLPRALIGGALLVSVLYVLLQYVFLRQASVDQLTGQVEVGQIVAENLFGSEGGRILSFAIALLLVSSISAMIWVGPRITRAMAGDYRFWQFLATDNARGVPVRAVWFQVGISVLLILVGSFRSVLMYSGFLLQLSSALAVAGIFVLRKGRWKGPSGYRSPFFTGLQLLYIAFSTWIIVYLIADQPLQSLYGAANLLIGLATYGIDRWMGAAARNGEG